MYLYFIATDSAGADAAAELPQAEIDTWRGDIGRIVPGLRNALTLPDFILAGKRSADVLVADELAKHFRCRLFTSFFDELLPGGDPAVVDKTINKFLGKEKVIVAVERGMWLRLVLHYGGADALQPDFSPGALTTVELYIKRFPAPGAAKLNYVRTAAELAASGK